MYAPIAGGNYEGVQSMHVADFLPAENIRIKNSNEFV